MAEINKVSAHRITKGSKTYIVVEMDGVEIARLGGKRAEYAQGAIVAKWGDEPAVVTGLRSDLFVAQGEARRLATSRPLVHRGVALHHHDGTPLMTTAAEWAMAVPVTTDGNEVLDAVDAIGARHG